MMVVKDLFHNLVMTMAGCEEDAPVQMMEVHILHSSKTPTIHSDWRHYANSCQLIHMREHVLHFFSLSLFWVLSLTSVWDLGRSNAFEQVFAEIRLKITRVSVASRRLDYKNDKTWVWLENFGNLDFRPLSKVEFEFGSNSVRAPIPDQYMYMIHTPRIS